MSDKPIIRRRIAPIRWWNAFRANRIGNHERTPATAPMPRPRISSSASLALALAAALSCASLARAGQSVTPPSLPDSPQPQQKAPPPPNPCLVKQASAGVANNAAAAAQAAPAAADTTAASGTTVQPAPKPPAEPDATLVPCTTVERILANLQQVGKLPAINWYARFLDGPQVQRMTPRQKAWLAFRNVADPFNAVTILGSSGIAVATNSHSAYGPGMTGFGRYVGVSYSQDLTGEFIGTFLIPSVVHQDPHYHRMPQASLKRRIAHVLYQVVWTQGDNGRGMINYADLAGFAIDDGIANLYVPGRETNARASFERYATTLALAPTDNAITEFLPDLARKIHVRVVLFQRIINQVANKDAANSQP